MILESKHSPNIPDRLPRRLQELRARLVAGRSTAPLFDMNLFVRSLENLYFAMWEERQTAGVGLPA